MKKYTFKERLNYTYKRNWFCKKKLLGFWIIYIASDMDIYIDWLCRDLKLGRDIRKK